MFALITIIGIFALLVGIALGYWFADFTKIRDLIYQKSQLKAKVERLEDLVAYLENKEKES